MNTLKYAGIFSLIFVVGLQINYLWGEQLKSMADTQKITLLISIIFAILFIFGLVITYKITRLNREKARFNNHATISVGEYDKLRGITTKKELNKLKRSAAYRQFVQQQKTKHGYSNAKTHSSLQSEQSDLPSGQEFQKLWLSQESKIFGSVEK